ncbi:MAG TPA: thioredoxin-dependent thiol peroxidase [Tepidiformaceae bacterium]|nr:thioredoxin-dependent thiol peroxidase [Tepidiformaceae bacterium]
MSMPPVDTEPPDFELNDQNGQTVRLRDLRGKWVVLYFYPKDDTSGCTKEACSFRDNHGRLQQRGAVVLGVSGDTEASHQKFADKYELPFPLLVDADHEVAKAYGAWGTKSMYGRSYEGIIRSTFVIGPDGRIAKVWPKVKPAGHGQEVLTWLTQHGG